MDHIRCELGIVGAGSGSGGTLALESTFLPPPPPPTESRGNENGILIAVTISEWFSVTVRVRVRPSSFIALGALSLPTMDENLDRQPIVVAPDHLLGVCPKPAVVRPYLAISVSSRPINSQSGWP